MSRILATITAFLGLLLAFPSSAQVVESNPDPARTDQSVTITFHADRGNEGLKDCNCDVYAHTGLVTEKSDDNSDWQYVMDDWPENRSLTKLSKVDANTYEFTISDIRDYYSKNNTGAGTVPPKSQEEIQKLAFVFRNADGTAQGKTESGGDIFVDVSDVGEGEPFVSANILNPDANPPLYPYMTSKDETVNVNISADVANVDSFDELRLFVDGTQVASTSDKSLTYELQTGTSPNRFQIRAEAEATADGNTLQDNIETEIIRTPNVVTDQRPSDVEDGINYNSDGTVTLSLYAPKKDFVYVIGDFTNWTIDNNYFMKRDGDHWWITLSGLQNGTEYDFQYFVDGEIRTSDPFSHKIRAPADREISSDVYPGIKSYPNDKTENFVSVLRPGQKNDNFNFSNFNPPKRENLVIYELLLRDFVDKSTFSVLTDTLDYLDRLGVNAVELMPVANFGGNSSWGYNPNAHLALDKSYGTPEGFKKFVEEAHSRGIAVIMDVVYNHITDQSPLVQLYGDPSQNPFIETGSDRGICGVFFRELNQGDPFIKKYIDRANEYWIEEFNVDGFRFDLAKCVADNGVNINDSQHSDAVTAGWKDVADYVWDNVDSDTYMILEFFGSPSVENELGGYRADNTGGMMTWHNMNRAFSQADMGFVEGDDFSSDFSASYYKNRGGYDQPSFIAYMESHDEQWLMRRKKKFGRSGGDYNIQEDLQTALNRQKLVGAFYFTTPGPRMMWQFGELGYGWGENECLRDDGSEESVCSSGAPGRTGEKPIRWDYRDPEKSPNRVKLYKAWSSLIKLRNQNDVFTSLQTDVSMKVGDGNAGRRIVLQHSNMDAIVIGNFGVNSDSISASFPSAGTWYDYFTGTAIEINEDETDTPIRLEPGEFHVFTSKAVDFPEEGLVPFDYTAPAPEPPSNLDTNIGTNDIEVSWQPSSASDLTGYALYRGRRAQFDTTGARVARVQNGTTSFTDTNAEPGTLYYYRAVALDADGVQSALSKSVPGVVYPQSFSFDVVRSFGRDTEQRNYRLVALPGAEERPLGETLSGEPGSMWQAYWDDGTSSNFFVQFDGSDSFRLKPGRGFWLISDSTWSVQGSVSSVTLDQGNVTTIDLHSGWNIISNPFDRGVPWSEVVNASGGGLQPLWSFSGGFSRVSTFASAATGEAFYFLNDQNLDQLTIPYAATPSPSATEKSQVEADLSMLTLEVQQVGKTASVQLGWAKDASAGVDRFDWVAPPTRFATLSLRSRPEQASSRRRKSLARNIRPPAKEGQSFTLRLDASSDETVQFRLNEADAFSGQELRLVNENTGRTYDLRNQELPAFQPRSETTKLTLLAGTERYVREKQKALSASELQLQPGYPNPFRQKTTLTYTVPDSGPVKLEVFDVLGRRVRVLVDERKEAGTYEVTWNGGNDAGRSVASGVYLGRLTFNGQTITQKMVHVK